MIVKNILTTFVQWKNKIVNVVKGTCLNHVVWANKSITDIGSQLWNENLIYRGILYITDFLNEDSTIMNYNQFCVNWDLDVSEITSRDYVDIKMAIRSFNCSTISNRNITKIDNEACLTFFRYNWSGKNNLSGKILREKMYMPKSPDSLPSIKKWSRELGRYSINWGQILSNTFTGVTNNYKLI